MLVMTHFSRILVLNTGLIGIPKLGDEGQVEAAEMVKDLQVRLSIASSYSPSYSKDSTWKQCQAFPLHRAELSLSGLGWGIFFCMNYETDFQPDAKHSALSVHPGCIDVYSLCPLHLPPFQPILIWRVIRGEGFFVSHFDFTQFGWTGPWISKENVDRLSGEGRQEERGESKADDVKTNQRIVNDDAFSQRVTWPHT